MGRTVNALLCFGFPAKPVDEGWETHEYENEDGEKLQPRNWFEEFDAQVDDEDGYWDFENWLVARLCGNKQPPKAHSDEWKAIRGGCPLELDSHGWSEEAIYVLTVKESIKTVYWGDEKTIPQEHFNRAEYFQAELKRGCEMASIPYQEGKWILGVYSD